MIYLYSIIHCAFALTLFTFWRFFDKKLDYRRYLLIVLTIGPLGTIIYDFLGVVVFKVWEYKSSNLLEYICIALCTYIIATPMLIETLNFVWNQLRVVKFKYSFTFSRLTAGLLSLVLIIFILNTISIGFSADRIGIELISVIFISSTLTMDLIIYALKNIRGPILDIFDGRILSPISILLSGFICGLLWELLNTVFPLWSYKNLPLGEVLGIPVVVIFFWGLLNAGYRFCVVMIFNDYAVKQNRDKKSRIKRFMLK